MRVLAFFIFSFVAAIAMAEDLGEWLATNEPIVERYLASLGNKDLDHPVVGVTLSDGTQPLKGYVFLANNSNPARGLHDYKFRFVYSGIVYESQYIWLDKGHPKLHLPPYLTCPGEFIEPGGVAVLSGDQFTYADLEPGGELVVTTCKLDAQQGAPVDAKKRRD
jgi:hypothetical protein